MLGFRFSIRTAFYLISAAAVLSVLVGAAVRGNALVAIGLLGAVMMLPALLVVHAAVYLVVCLVGRRFAAGNTVPAVPEPGGAP